MNLALELGRAYMDMRKGQALGPGNTGGYPQRLIWDLRRPRDKQTKQGGVREGSRQRPGGKRGQSLRPKNTVAALSPPCALQTPIWSPSPRPEQMEGGSSGKAIPQGAGTPSRKGPPSRTAPLDGPRAQ